ncbi:hypothetical protein BV20DRAFT_635292 [Pilatotrama ljubarskyi]|nr:hypothetical protein BV20DRAFT_635292 [Pilatotrama ljubarskyi]
MTVRLSLWASVPMHFGRAPAKRELRRPLRCHKLRDSSRPLGRARPSCEGPGGVCLRQESCCMCAHVARLSSRGSERSVHPCSATLVPSTAPPYRHSERRGCRTQRQGRSPNPRMRTRLELHRTRLMTAAKKARRGRPLSGARREQASPRGRIGHSSILLCVPTGALLHSTVPVPVALRAAPPRLLCLRREVPYN